MKQSTHLFRLLNSLGAIAMMVLCGTIKSSAIAASLPLSSQTSVSAKDLVLSDRVAQLPTALPDSNPLVPPRPDLVPLPQVSPAPLPTSPLQPPAIQPSTQEPVPTAGATIRVEKVEVLGSRVFSRSELAAVVRPYERRNLTFEQLLEIRTAITRLYSDRGYVTSGAFLPPQDDLATGIIKIQVIEGGLERVEIMGLRRLHQSYVRRRVEQAAKPPLNLRKLETALQLLQINPLFSSVRAELNSGTTPGRSVLKVMLKEAPAVRAAGVVGNPDSPSVGEYRGTLLLGHDNLLGLGDRFGAELGLTSGVTDLSLGYSLPLNPRDGTLNLRFERNRSQIVEAPFSVLEIKSSSQTLSAGFRQPIVRSPTREVALSLGFDVRQSETFLFDNVPFSFSPGPDLGVSKVRVLRFSQDWISRSPRRVLAARSQLSFGLPIFGATLNDAGIDGNFFAWVGQFQYVQSIGRDVIAIARVAAQLTPDSLLPLEQFSIGGVDTVRGYRQNQRVGDNGVLGSLEFRIPIIQQADGIGLVQLAPFVDVGKVWNTSNSSASVIPKPQLLASTGLGLRWQIGAAFTARFDWGIPLAPITRQGNALQDSGIVFSARLQFL